MKPFHSPEARAKATIGIRKAWADPNSKIGFHRPRTEDEKRRIGETLKATLAADPELRARRAPKGRRHTAQSRALLSLAQTGRHHTPEARAKMSVSKTGKRFLSDEHYAKLSRERRGQPSRFPMRRFYYAGEAFRSSWELRVATALDALGVRWEYEPRRFDLGSQTWAPDFYLPDGDCWFEVKGYFGPKSQRTVALFRQRYPDVKLLLVRKDAMEALERAAIQRAA